MYKIFFSKKTFYIRRSWKLGNIDEDASLVIKLVNNKDIIPFQVEEDVFVNGTIECSGGLKIIWKGKISFGKKGVINPVSLSYILDLPRKYI